MPRGDGTGPTGKGPMTGRGAGYCAGYSTPGYENAGRSWLSSFGTVGRWVRGVLPRLALRRGLGRGRNRQPQAVSSWRRQP